MKTERTLYREGKYLVLDGTGEERRNKEAILQEGIYVVREYEGSERSKRAKRRKLTLIFSLSIIPFPVELKSNDQSAKPCDGNYHSSQWHGKCARMELGERHFHHQTHTISC